MFGMELQPQGKAWYDILLSVYSSLVNEDN